MYIAPNVRRVWVPHMLCPCTRRYCRQHRVQLYELEWAATLFAKSACLLPYFRSLAPIWHTSSSITARDQKEMWFM